MNKDKAKSSSMNLVLIEQHATQNELARWTYQAEMQIDLSTGVSETLEVTVFTHESDTSVDLAMVNMTLSFNDLDGKAYQFQSVLHNVKAVGTSEPVVKIGVSEKPNTVPETWWTLQEGTIHALKQIAAGSTKTSVTIYVQLSGLSLPYVHAINTSVDSSMGEIRFIEALHPAPKYSGDFEPLGSGKQFSSMENACQAVIARGLPLPMKKVGMGCEISFKYIPAGSSLAVQIPVGIVPFTLIDDNKSFASVLSNLILAWLKVQGIAHAKKEEFLFNLSIYAPDENTKTPWLIMNKVVLPLENVHIPH